MKDNYHRDLHHALTQSSITPEQYHAKIEKFNRESIRKALRQNLKKSVKINKGVTSS